MDGLEGVMRATLALAHLADPLNRLHDPGLLSTV
jgi:hypothetical protein